VIVRTAEVARASVARTQGGAVAVAHGRERLAVTGMSGEEVASLLARRGLGVFELVVERATLEDAFMQTYCRDGRLPRALTGFAAIARRRQAILFGRLPGRRP
jgi:hypothetical protein